MEQRLEQVRPPLIADTQATKAEQPGKCALHHPAVPSEPLAGVNPTASNSWRDATGAQGATEVRRVVGLVGVQLGGTLPRTTGLPSRADDRRDGVDERDELRRVVSVGRRETDRQRNPGAVDDQVVLGAGLAAVNRVRPGPLAPLLARTLTESRLARLHSMAASSPNQFSSVSCSRSQTLTACQSRSRRQQVVPLPHPSSFGRSRHGQPVRSTKTMPPRTARSGTRGRPPFGLGCSFGSSGSMASQRSSGTRDVAFMIGHHAIGGTVLKHALNYHNELGSWFDVSLSDRVPVGMMTIVYDVSFEHFAHGIPGLRKKMDKETFLYLANLGTEIAAEQDELGNPIEFSATVDYRFSVTKKASEADISLTQGADGSPLRFVEVAKDPSRTHPLLQKDVISKLRAAVGEGSKVNQHDIRCIVAVYKTPSRPDFYYRSSLQGSPQYSEGFVDWILLKYNQDPAFFATTRLKAKPILVGPMLNPHRQGKAPPGLGAPPGTVRLK